MIARTTPSLLRPAARVYTRTLLVDAHSLPELEALAIERLRADSRLRADLITAGGTAAQLAKRWLLLECDVRQSVRALEGSRFTSLREALAAVQRVAVEPAVALLYANEAASVRPLPLLH